MPQEQLTILAFVLAAAAWVATPAAAQMDADRPLEEVDIEQRFDAQVPLEAVFRDESGREVRLGDYFEDKPVILNPVYLECPRLCKLTIRGLIQTLKTMSFDVGTEFEVITFSFDPRETPDMAAGAKKTALELYGRKGAADGWHFLTGDQPSIDALLDAIGFRVVFDPRLKQYAHAAGIMILTPEGRVCRYLNGVEYPATDVRLALVEASENEIGSPSDQVLLLCYQYNPELGKYSWAVDAMLKVFGLGWAALIVCAVVIMLRREKKSPLRSLDGRLSG